MKHFIVLVFIFSAVSAKGQITLEHTYQQYNSYLFLSEVDSGEWKYILFNQKDSIVIFNINHSFEKTIIIPSLGNKSYFYPLLSFVSKKLFTLNDIYCYFLQADAYDTINKRNLGPLCRIFDQDGNLLFSCDTCGLNVYQDPVIIKDIAQLQPIFNTNNGTKMLIERGDDNRHEVYSLPGKLPNCTTTKLGVTQTPMIINGNSLPTSAYPNPSSGQMRISYKLPPGAETGELVISNIEGVVVKRYKVGNIFNDILIEKSDLPSVSYFYKLITSKGESETKQLVILK
jgi:hypothetical protein